MTKRRQETNHNSADEIPPFTMPLDHDEFGQSLPEYEDAARVKELLRQLGVEAIAGLTLAATPEHSHNQQLRDNIASRLVGQTRPIDAVMEVLDRSVLKDPTKPYCFMLFVGPTGVGKTELVRVLNQFLHNGEPGHLTQINCEEFSLEHEVATLVGSPPGFVGYGETPKLHQDNIKGDKHILLFDELEKGHESLKDLLLSITEDGKLIMKNGDETDFSKCIVIATSNIGAGELNKALSNKSSGFAPQSAAANLPSPDRMKAIVDEAIKRELKPELIGRVDESILFDSLDDAQLGDVVRIYNEKLNERLVGLGYKLHLTPSLVDALVASDPGRREYGARHITKTFRRIVASRLGKFISAGSFPVGSDIYAGLTGSATGNRATKDVEFDFFSAPNKELLEEYNELQRLNAEKSAQESDIEGDPFANITYIIHSQYARMEQEALAQVKMQTRALADQMHFNRLMKECAETLAPSEDILEQIADAENATDNNTAIIVTFGGGDQPPKGEDKTNKKADEHEVDSPEGKADEAGKEAEKAKDDDENGDNNTDGTAI